MVVADGRIVSVANGSADGPGPQIDAQGMSVMPGLIDTHRHDLTPDRLENDTALAEALENETPRNLQTLLNEGFTTIMVPGSYRSVAREVRRRLGNGELAGPRVLNTGPTFVAPGDFLAVTVCSNQPYCVEHSLIEVSDAAIAREMVRELAAEGVDAIKAWYDSVLMPEVRLDDSVLAAILDEARTLGLPAMVHAETAEDMIRVVELGAQKLVHTPYVGLIGEGPGAALLREAGIPISTTVSFSSAQFAEVSGEGLRTSEHQILLQNIRHLWDQGVIVAFGTDSPRPTFRPIIEIEELSRVLTPAEIITSITLNAAIFLGLSDDLGTLESGKIADIILVDGDPLADISDLANVAVVIQGGRVVVDNR